MPDSAHASTKTEGPGAVFAPGPSVEEQAGQALRVVVLVLARTVFAAVVVIAG